MRARFRTGPPLLLVAGLLLSTQASSSESEQAVALPGPGRLVPDVGPTSPGLVDVLDDGTRRLIVSGMRILDFPDGSIERAREILPAVTLRPPIALPSRLGGGVLFAVWVGEQTQLWRAKSWMGDLAPLAVVPGKVGEIVPGFDRIYLGFSGGLRAIDPISGAPRSIQPLPGVTAIGSFAFADAWRAVAVVDYRGALTTFDAGNSWRPVPLFGGVSRVTVRDGTFVFDTPGRRFLLGTSGEVVLDEPASTDVLPAPAPSQGRRTFAQRPLRAAIEGGWPLRGPRGEPTAVFAQSGTLYRVALQTMGADHPTGSILEAHPGAFRAEDDFCRAIPLQHDFGFVCDSPSAGSAIYAFERPLSMHEIARFEHHREISSSGNGGLVVAGSCSRNDWGLGESGAFCFLFPSGDEREVMPPALAPGRQNGLRPVALRDGRALFLVQPSDESSGSLLVAEGGGFVTVPLVLGERESWLRNAMIEGGVEERELGALGAWALVGNDLRGVRIGMDGKVTLGTAAVANQRTAVSGRYAFDWGTTTRGQETTDGGISWSVVDVVSAPIEGATDASAACGPVGASEGVTGDGKPSSWLRIGWGSTPEAPDLVMAKTPEPPPFHLHPPSGVSMRCEPTGEIAGPALAKPRPSATPRGARGKKPAPPEKNTILAANPLTQSGGFSPPQLMPPRSLPPIFNPSNMSKTPPVAPPSTLAASPWTSFHGIPPPQLRRDEEGFEAGTDTSQARIYVWGKKGADWFRNGHVQVRFDDRFDLAGTRATAITASPWPDDEKAADALGVSPQQSMTWSALLDVSGQAAVLVGQRPGRTDLYGAAQGEPLAAWRDVGGAPLMVPLPGSVVRMDGTWFYLGSPPGQGPNAATIYRVDGGIVRRLARLPRVQGDSSSPRLTRRARGRGLGLLIRGTPGFDQAMRDWFVLPINEESGELDEPVRLYGSDLEGRLPARCAPDEDGWLVLPEFGLPPALTMVAPAVANFTFVEARLRLEPGRACVVALASREEGLVSPTSGGRRPIVFDDDAAIPLAATDVTSGRRWLLRCGQ